jgi:hypothetical protein
MRARGSKSGVKNKTPKSPEPREYLGKIGIFLILNSNFPHTKFDFLQRLSDIREIRENLLRRLSAFFNSFLLSSTAFRFLQRLSAFYNGFPIFLNGFPISEKYKKIYLRRQVYERLLFELCISRHLLPELRNSC